MNLNKNEIDIHSHFFSEFYQQFLVEDFDVKEHASHVLQGSVVSEQLSKLSEGIVLLNKIYMR